MAVEDFQEEDGMLMARSRVIEPVYNAKERELDVVSRTLISLFEQLVKQSRKLPPEVLASLSGIDDPSRVGRFHRRASFRAHGRQAEVLETADVGQRLELLIGLVDGEMDLQQVEKRIRGRVKSQMEKSQREYYLNEQMKAIQKELGDSEDGPNEIEELQKKIETLGHAEGCVDQGAGRNSASSSRCRRCLPKPPWCATISIGWSVCRGKSAARCARICRWRRKCSTPIISVWKRSRIASWNILPYSSA